MPPQQQPPRKLFDANSLLTTILIALSGWILAEVKDLGKGQVMMSVQIQNLERVVYKKD